MASKQSFFLYFLKMICRVKHVIPNKFQHSFQIYIQIMKSSLIIAVLFVISYTAVIPFDNEAVDKIFNQKNDALFLFVGDEEGEKSALEAFQAYDQTNPSIVLSLSSKNDGHGLFDRLAEYLGVSTATTPQVLYLRSATNKYKYNYDGLTAQNLANFVERANRGQIQPFLKSAPIPESNDEPVKVVVGKTFKEYVFDSHKEVLVKFYAPWCGHCKHIAPHFDEAAKRLLNNPNVLLIKVDSTENQVEGLDIQSFPTIKFWRRDKSAVPLDFNGQRTADGIVEWIKEHTEYEWVETANGSAASEPQAEQL